MDTPRTVAPRSTAGGQPSAQLAKAALRRLALEKLEPTPENFTRAYMLEAGDKPPTALSEPPVALLERLAVRALPSGPVREELCKTLAHGKWEQAQHLLEQHATPPQDVAVQASALAGLIERIVGGIQRGGRQWTTARRKSGLQRVLTSSRTDVQLLQARLSQLVASWDSDAFDQSVDLTELDAEGEAPKSSFKLGRVDEGAALGAANGQPANESSFAEAFNGIGLWQGVLVSLSDAVQRALPAPPAPNAELATELSGLTQAMLAQGPTAEQRTELDHLCHRTVQVLQHRHHLIDQLGTLCQELTVSLVELAEDDSWAKGQCEVMSQHIEDGLTARSARSVSELLKHTRERHSQLRAERAQTRDELKALIQRMLSDLGELGSQTGRFHESLGRYAGVIENADSLEKLAGTVREMVEESRTVRSLVLQAQSRLQYEHTRATELSERVSELESELRRLSEDVSTDQLTKIANRRGLMQAFEAERGRVERDGSRLAIGLLDIDNFKRLNDELGHNVGDKALKALAEVVSKALRPMDMVARYGGEEFVVLLPSTLVDEGQQILTRLQRSLSEGLFMHDQRQVLVTFSAGITTYRPGERIEVALERADSALYEAKRTGKNRTCIA